jgi:hypothetical protein
MTRATLDANVPQVVGELRRLRERDYVVRVDMPGAPARLAPVSCSLAGLRAYAFPLSLRVGGFQRQIRESLSLQCSMHGITTRTTSRVGWDERAAACAASTETNPERHCAESTVTNCSRRHAW